MFPLQPLPRIPDFSELRSHEKNVDHENVTGCWISLGNAPDVDSAIGETHRQSPMDVAEGCGDGVHAIEITFFDENIDVDCCSRHAPHGHRNAAADRVFDLFRFQHPDKRSELLIKVEHTPVWHACLHVRRTKTEWEIVERGGGSRMTASVGESVKLACVDQSRTLDPGKTLFEEITGGGDVVQLGTREMSSRAYVARFNFSGTDQQKKVGALSGGERNRVHLAKMLKEGANVLLLDEPTNDLDVNTMRALEEALDNFAGCAIVISHDRWFLDRVATHILAFEGDSRVYWFDGNYSEYEEDKRKRLGAEADQPHRIRYRQMTR